MAFSQTLTQENCHEQHLEEQQVLDSQKLGGTTEEEDIDNHYGGTPIKFLPLHHVYSATSPCVSASCSSKKVRARKLTVIDDHRLLEQQQCKVEVVAKVQSDLPPLIKVYSRRKRKLSVENKELESGEERGVMVKSEPIEVNEGLVADVNGGVLSNKRRRVVNSEIDKLGVDSSVSPSVNRPRLQESRRVVNSENDKLGVDSSVSPSVNRPRLRESRFQYNVAGACKSVVKKKKQNSPVNHKNRNDWQAKKWFQLYFDGVQPTAFVGLKCQVYWPLDDVWYQGSVSGYEPDTKQHNVKYDDGDAETLVLSREQIKFHISREEMQELNLIGKEWKDDDDPDYSQLIGLAASVDESRELEAGDIIWAKLTGHAMWPAVIMDESLVSDRKGLNKNSGRRSVPVQFFGSHDFARVQVKQIVSFVKGLLSCFHLKCKSPKFLRGLKEAKSYLNEQRLPKSMLSVQCECEDVQTIDPVESSKKDDDLPNTEGTYELSSHKSKWEKCQRLPGGQRPISINWKDLDRCNVCHMDEEYENNLFLQCDTCRMMVHARCYGEESVDGGLWLCNMCRVGAPETIPLCRLCPIVGGAMKPTTDGHWAHLACAIWIPETCLSDIKKMEPIDGLNRINKDRWKLLCSICHIPYGACIQCSNNTCYVAYHPLCARVSGYCLELENEDKMHLISMEEDEEEQCIRLLSFCSKHKQPSNGHPILDEGHGKNSCEDSIYEPPSNLSGCARCEPYDYSARRGRKEPEILASTSGKRVYLENMPHLVGGFCLHDSLAHLSGKGNMGIGSKISLGIRNGSSNQESPPCISSMADKYRYMRETFRKRLAFGKSKIHGFGIFARQPHKAGDMVIEYTGEIVRPPVADRREHFIYNSLVGAGTYMFRIDDKRVIDATRAGSIAHLINHSCDPNCYSRVITVCGDEHIIIFAKRDIKQNEELTYDYRFFSIDVKLPCSCGAKGCRGVVNDIEAEEQAAKLYVPRFELIDWKGD